MTYVTIPNFDAKLTILEYMSQFRHSISDTAYEMPINQYVQRIKTTCAL